MATNTLTSLKSMFAGAVLVVTTILLVLIWLEEPWPTALLLTGVAVMTIANTYAIGGVVKIQTMLVAKDSLEAVTARLTRQAKKKPPTSWQSDAPTEPRLH